MSLLLAVILACLVVPCMAGGGKPTELFFMALTLIIGVIVRQCSKHTRVPFTVVMFVVGFVLCQFGIWMPSLYDGLGLNMSHMDPHTLLYSFLPILIFESAFAMHVHIFSGLIKPCIILAGPGLLFCSFLSGAFIKGLHSEWSFIKALLLGVTLSATDPVAVVALLKELGASPQVSTLIEGESLLNDGSAIVVFNILYGALETNTIGSAGSIIGTFIRLAVGGPIFGFICGLIAVKLISRTFNDAVIEISITLVGAYLVFYVGEGLLGVSGVLALVAMGVTMASNKNSISPEVEHAMHDFWGILVWYANTLIFTLVGVQCRNAFASHHIVGFDWLRLLALYLFLNVVRFAMLLICRPLINSGHGYHLDWKNAVLCGWGGLRGGVGLALALIISNTPILLATDPRMAEVAEFYTSGIVILTILVNGVTTQNLVARLQLATTQAVKSKALYYSLRKLQQAADSSIRTGKLTAAIANADWRLVSSFTQTWLDDQVSALPPAECSPNDYLHHLVLGLFHAAVWRQYKEGLALKRTTRTLIAMIEDAEEHGHDVGGARLVQHYIQRKPPLSSLPFVRGEPAALTEVDLCLCYIAAMDEVVERLDQSTAAATEPALLLHEQDALRRGVAVVRQHLVSLEQSAPQVTQRLKTAYASRRVLNSCRIVLGEALEDGTIDEDTAERIHPGLEGAMRRVRVELVKKEARVQQPNDVLLALPWVQLLAPQAQQRLLALVASNARTAPPSAVLTELHQSPGGVGLILTGTVSLASRTGKPLYLGAGTLFNCYCFLTAKPAIQRVVAESDVRYAWFPDELLNELLPPLLPPAKLTYSYLGNNYGHTHGTGTGTGTAGTNGGTNGSPGGGSPGSVTQGCAAAPTANPAREALWHDVGVRVAIAMLETNLTFAALGRERLLALCTHGRVYRLIPEKAVPLWPAYHYLLLRGSARRLTDNAAFTAPAVLLPSTTATVEPAAAVASLTPDQREQLQSAFRLFDRDGSGALDEVEFLSAMRFMGCEVGLPEARQLLAEADADGSDGLDLDEFVAITLRNMMVFSCDAKVFAVPKWMGGAEAAAEAPRTVATVYPPTAPVRTALPTLLRDPSDGSLPTSTLLQPIRAAPAYPQFKPYTPPLGHHGAG